MTVPAPHSTELTYMMGRPPASPNISFNMQQSVSLPDHLPLYMEYPGLAARISSLAGRLEGYNMEFLPGRFR